MIQTVMKTVGRRIAVIDSLRHIGTRLFNARGSQLAMQAPWVSLTARVLVQLPDARDNVTTMSYNSLDGIIDPAGFYGGLDAHAFNSADEQVADFSRTTTTYDSVGNPVIRIDALGFRTSVRYNVFDKPALVVNALGQVTSSAYDTQGRPIANIDALCNRTSFAYDLSGRLIEQTDALGRRTTVLYDAAGRPQAQIEALGFRTSV